MTLRNLTLAAGVSIAVSVDKCMLTLKNLTLAWRRDGTGRDEFNDRGTCRRARA